MPKWNRNIWNSNVKGLFQSLTRDGWRMEKIKQTEDKGIGRQRTEARENGKCRYEVMIQFLCYHCNKKTMKRNGSGIWRKGKNEALGVTAVKLGWWCGGGVPPEAKPEKNLCYSDSRNQCPYTHDSSLLPQALVGPDTDIFQFRRLNLEPGSGGLSRPIKFPIHTDSSVLVSFLYSICFHQLPTVLHQFI